MEYLFGDTDIAARRLKVLADVFAPSTRAFLLEAVTDRLGLILDLGCGPDYSTHLLAEVLRCGHVAGLDNSARIRQWDSCFLRKPFYHLN